MKKVINLIILVMAAIVLACPAQAAEEDKNTLKRKLRDAVIGKWEGQKNKYKIQFNMEIFPNGYFSCHYEEPNMDPTDWLGRWKVRAQKNGAVMIFLKARNKADDKAYSKGTLYTDSYMKKYMTDITFNYTSTKKFMRRLKLQKAGAEDEDEDEESFDDEDDEDYDDEEEEEEEEDYDEDEEYDFDEE